MTSCDLLLRVRSIHTDTHIIFIYIIDNTNNMESIFICTSICNTYFTIPLWLLNL